MKFSANEFFSRIFRGESQNVVYGFGWKTPKVPFIFQCFSLSCKTIFSHSFGGSFLRALWAFCRVASPSPHYTCLSVCVSIIAGADTAQRSQAFQCLIKARDFYRSKNKFVSSFMFHRYCWRVSHRPRMCTEAYRFTFSDLLFFVFLVDSFRTHSE